MADKPRSGRPIKADEESAKKIMEYVRRLRGTRSANCAQIAEGCGLDLSEESVRMLLHANGFKKVKRTTKPGLSAKQKEERLQWCIKHKDIDWKSVCFSDETSVVLGQRRGTNRVWRQFEEAQDDTCRRNRWKGFMTFMFWGSFSYYYKGPCHIFKDETAIDKKRAVEAIQKLNGEREPELKAQWELDVGFRRGLDLKRPGKVPGRQPVWKFDKAHGKLERSKKGGIDWWRYRNDILLPKLIPFCQKNKLIVQEDGAASHTAEVNQELIKKSGLQRLGWAGNSPDLNQIEPAWSYLKRESQNHKNWEHKKSLPKIWERCWSDLPQERIQAWIDRMPRHIKLVTELAGGNNYREGRFDRDRGYRSFNAVKGRGLDRRKHADEESVSSEGSEWTVDDNMNTGPLTVDESEFYIDTVEMESDSTDEDEEACSVDSSE